VHAVHVREANCHSLASYAVPAYPAPAQSLSAQSVSAQSLSAESLSTPPGPAAAEQATSELDGFDGDFSFEEIQRAVQPDLAPGTEIRTEVVDGLAARVLLERCAGADMLVLGTASDESGAPRSAGPVIRACLRRAPCPVVVISVAQDPLRYSEPALVPAGAVAGAPPPAAVPAIAGV
jgi:nucleotide-binding universal stress UspA family protein